MPAEWPSTEVLEATLREITDTRARRPETIAELARARTRRVSPLGDRGKALIIAADHPARGSLRAGADPLAMADRADLLMRLCVALARPGVTGVLGTADILEDLLLLGALHDRSVFGSMNRGGLAGASFELDDRFTGYDVHVDRPVPFRRRQDAAARSTCPTTATAPTLAGVRAGGERPGGRAADRDGGAVRVASAPTAGCATTCRCRPATTAVAIAAGLGRHVGVHVAEGPGDRRRRRGHGAGAGRDDPADAAAGRRGRRRPGRHLRPVVGARCGCRPCGGWWWAGRCCTRPTGTSWRLSTPRRGCCETRWRSRRRRPAGRTAG